MPDNARANLEAFGHSNLEGAHCGQEAPGERGEATYGLRKHKSVLGVKVCDLWFDMSNIFGATFCARGVFSSIQVCWAEDSCPTTSGRI